MKEDHALLYRTGNTSCWSHWQFFAEPHPRPWGTFFVAKLSENWAKGLSPIPTATWYWSQLQTNFLQPKDLCVEQKQCSFGELEKKKQKRKDMQLMLHLFSVICEFWSKENKTKWNKPKEKNKTHLFGLWGCSNKTEHSKRTKTTKRKKRNQDSKSFVVCLDIPVKAKENGVFFFTHRKTKKNALFCFFSLILFFVFFLAEVAVLSWLLFQFSWLVLVDWFLFFSCTDQQDSCVCQSETNDGLLSQHQLTCPSQSRLSFPILVNELVTKKSKKTKNWSTTKNNHQISKFWVLSFFSYSFLNPNWNTHKISLQMCFEIREEQKSHQVWFWPIHLTLSHSVVQATLTKACLFPLFIKKNTQHHNFCSVSLTENALGWKCCFMTFKSGRIVDMSWKQNSFVPLLRGRPNNADHSGPLRNKTKKPKSNICVFFKEKFWQKTPPTKNVGTTVVLSTLLTVVGQQQDCWEWWSELRLPGFPSVLPTNADSSPQMYAQKNADLFCKHSAKKPTHWSSKQEFNISKSETDSHQMFAFARFIAFSPLSLLGDKITTNINGSWWYKNKSLAKKSERMESEWKKKPKCKPWSTLQVQKQRKSSISFVWLTSHDLSVFTCAWLRFVSINDQERGSAFHDSWYMKQPSTLRSWLKKWTQTVSLSSCSLAWKTTSFLQSILHLHANAILTSSPHHCPFRSFSFKSFVGSNLPETRTRIISWHEQQKEKSRNTLYGCLYPSFMFWRKVAENAICILQQNELVKHEHPTVNCFLFFFVFLTK